MPSRRKVIAGNWKMHYTPEDAQLYVEAIQSKICTDKADVVLCVPYVLLQTVKNAIKGPNIKVAAQNMHHESQGAYTGEISAEMLKAMGITFVVIGHSERRQYFAETDIAVGKKTVKALECGLTPIVCVGESYEQRVEGDLYDVLDKQVNHALFNVKPQDMHKVVIAYEPIWAIGTGATATSEQAEEACEFVREIVEELHGEDAASAVRILYGGSVNDKNADELFSMENIDGGLVGGASIVAPKAGEKLSADALANPPFVKIVEAGVKHG